MDSSIPGIPNSPLPNTAVFADNVQDLVNAGALRISGGGGGGINNSGTLKVSNSTISGNSTGSEGGGIYNDYSGTVTQINWLQFSLNSRC